MPLYTLTFERTVTSRAMRTVEAEDEDDAYEQGDAMVHEITDWEFEDEDIEVIGVDNDEEE